MTVKVVTWKFWVGVATATIAYVLILIGVGNNNVVLELTYKLGLTATTLIALAFVLGSIFFSLSKNSTRMWKSDLGGSVLLVKIALIPSFGGLAWTFLFDDGILRPGVNASITLTGPLLLAFALCWTFIAWGRSVRRKQRELNKKTEE